MGKAVVVASGKGGTGKTSFCAGISSFLAAGGKKVLVADLDCGNRNLDIVLGMTGSLLFSFADVVLERCGLISACSEHPEIKGLHVLTAPAVGLPEGVTANGIKKLMLTAKDSFDYVILDCPSGVSAYIGMFASTADLGVIVSTPDGGALRSGELMASALLKWGVPDIRLVLNRVRPRLIEKGHAYNIDDAIDMTGIPLLGAIPEDLFVIAASNLGCPVMKWKKSKAAKAFRNITERMSGLDVPLMKI